MNPDAMTKTSIPLEQAACDCCGSIASESFIEPSSNVPGMAEECRIVRCRECGLLYTNPRPTAEGIARCYQGYYGTGTSLGGEGSFRSRAAQNRMLRSLWHALCGQYLSEVLSRAHGRVLEAGCGRGDLLEELRDRGCDVHGVELDAESVAACRKKELDVTCGNFEDAPFDPESFDTVIFWHSLEHLPSPRTAFDKAWTVLKPGGRLFVHAPNAGSYLAGLFKRHWYAWQLPFHFYHFDTDSLQLIAERAGFSVVRLATATPEYFFAHSLNRVFKESTGRWRLLRRPGLYRSLIFRLSIIPVFRIADACMPRAGECLRGEFRKGTEKG